jgi:hypothetical protein
VPFHKSFVFRTANFCAICATTLICLQAELAWAQKGKPGGGTSSNAATATLDPIANTLRISGDGSRNRILVDLRDGVAYLSGFGVTSINGSLSNVTVPYDPVGFTLILEGNGGNDDLWVNVNAVEMAAAVQVQGGEGHDYIAVTTPIGPSLVAALNCVGGAGDDLIHVAVNGSLWIDSVLSVQAGDGSDQVEVGMDVLVGGSFTLDGGKRTDELSITPELFGFSNVSGFESVLFW